MVINRNYFKMNICDFEKKWVNRLLYETGGQVIKCYNQEFYCKDYLSKIMADFYLIPSIMGFLSEKQRRDFYKDAKSAGVRRHPEKKNVFYKRIFMQPKL